MTKPADDLEAVRAVVEAVQGFKEDEQQRIFRWAAEKLGLKLPSAVVASAGTAAVVPTSDAAPPLPTSLGAPTQSGQDVKTFVASKNPRSDVQFAATIAYFYQFEAPQAERKKCIGKDDLQEATRKSNRDRLKRPDQTLRNAHMLGLLDKGDEKGTFCVNTVGENLVAMTLPGDGTEPKSRARKTSVKRRPKVARKRAVANKRAGKKD